MVGVPVRFSFPGPFSSKLIPFVEPLPPFSQPAILEKIAPQVQEINKILGKVISSAPVFDTELAFGSWLERELPIVSTEGEGEEQGSFSLFVFSRLSGAFMEESFFLKWVKSYLYPQGQLFTLAFRQLQFFLPQFSFGRFFVAEVTFVVNHPSEFVVVRSHLQGLVKEMRRQMQLPQLAAHMPAIPCHEDAEPIRDILLQVMQRWPHRLETGVLKEFYRFLIVTEKTFRMHRSPRHLVRVMCSHYFMHKEVLQLARFAPHISHISVRVVQTQLTFAFGSSRCLGLIVAAALPDPHDCLEDTHLVLAVQQFCPHVRAVHGSFYFREEGSTRLLYLELEKREGTYFSSQEIHVLKTQLENELRKRVERRSAVLFKARNEEEVMKNILRLKQELRYVADIPQVMIFLEEQTSSSLVFTILLARIVKKTTRPISEYFSNFGIQYIPDWTRRLGTLRGKYPQEAHVFRLKIDKESSFLMKDSSVNFYRARRHVLKMLTKALGGVRDYNGGLISEQEKMLSALRQQFADVDEDNLDFLDTFFFSLTPVESQFTLSLSTLARLFEVFLDTLKEPLSGHSGYVLKVCDEHPYLFLSVRTEMPGFQEGIAIDPTVTVSTMVNAQGVCSLNLIYKEHDAQKRKVFLGSVQSTLQEWHKKTQNAQVLRLSVPFLPVSLDPRVEVGDAFEEMLRMLYDGLMRIDKNGTPVCAIACAVYISEDLKTYKFILRDALWSNGAKITAYDFAYTWKKILSPNFKTPFVHLFYCIKNAEAAKEGRCPLEDVGVCAKDAKTLIVELEHPAPHFLELTAHSLFAPVNHAVDQMHPNWPTQRGLSYVCSGPFCLADTVSSGYKLVKNPNYWDHGAVRLDQILISRAPVVSAFEMFQQDKVDWIGRPMTPAWGANFFKTCDDRKQQSFSNSTYWSICNVTRFPFHHPKIRKALAYAINRKRIIEELSYAGVPASTPVPLVHSQHAEYSLEDGNEEEAERLFHEALQELGIEKRHFPIFSFLHVDRELRAQVAMLIQQQWRDVLGIQCITEAHAWPSLFSKMLSGDYQIAGVSWSALINDPMYTLAPFTNSKNPMNFAKWEDPLFQKILQDTFSERDEIKRCRFFGKAERILIEQLPVIPLFHDMESHAQKEHLHGVYMSPLGRLDFKYAYIFKNPSKEDCHEQSTP